MSETQGHHLRTFHGSVCAAAEHTGLKCGQFVAIRGCGNESAVGRLLPDVWNTHLDISLGRRGETIEIWGGDCWVNIDSCHAVLFTDFEHVCYTVQVEGYDGSSSLVPSEREKPREKVSTKYRAVNDVVAVRMWDRPDGPVKLESGLYAPDVLRKTTNIGTVVSVGEWANGLIAPGDVVLTFGIHQEAVEENNALVRFHKLHEILSVVAIYD